MKGVIKNLVFILALISVMTFIPGCEKPEESYSYSFKVVSSGGNFYGYYCIDDGEMTEFEGTTFGTTGNLFSFEREMKTATSITIFASGDTPTTSAITIYIYKDSAPVKTAVGDRTDVNDVITVDLTYTFNEDTEE